MWNIGMITMMKTGPSNGGIELITRISLLLFIMFNDDGQTWY